MLFSYAHYTFSILLCARQKKIIITKNGTSKTEYGNQKCIVLIKLETDSVETCRFLN